MSLFDLSQYPIPIQVGKPRSAFFYFFSLVSYERLTKGLRKAYGLRIVVCFAAAIVQTIGFNLDQKMCTAPPKGQLLLYYLLVMWHCRVLILFISNADIKIGSIYAIQAPAHIDQQVNFYPPLIFLTDL
jgi:hypothetical protein